MKKEYMEECKLCKKEGEEYKITGTNKIDVKELLELHAEKYHNK